MDEKPTAVFIVSVRYGTRYNTTKTYVDSVWYSFEGAKGRVDELLVTPPTYFADDIYAYGIEEMVANIAPSTVLQDWLFKPEQGETA